MKWMIFKNVFFSSLVCGLLGLLVFAPGKLVAQTENQIDYQSPKEYIIADITVSGSTLYDEQSLVMLSGLAVGQHIVIPGEKITSAMEKLWKQGLFENVSITASKIIRNQIYLDIFLQERPRLSKVEYNGLKRLDISNLKDELKIEEGISVTDNTLTSITAKTEKFFKEKGFLNVEVKTIKKPDTTKNGLVLILDVNKHERVKISKIEIEGNTAEKSTADDAFAKRLWHNLTDPSDLVMSDKKIKRKLKNTKERAFMRFWKRSKFNEPDFKEDIAKVVSEYNKNGFRDMSVVDYHYDQISPKRIQLNLVLSEGNPYYFGDITFVGNTKYTTEQLEHVLDIKKGDVYNEEKLNNNLQFNQQTGDIFSLYYDNGYLSFQAIPVENNVENDTIDLEIRIREGKQANFNRIGVSGNTRTNDHVIIRELRTYPGQLFSRSDILNSLNELRMLRYFNDQTINPNVAPDPNEGAADLTYELEEVGSDQLELSGGWGGGYIVGTLGLSFNNFSIQNLFKKNSWKPLPSGDGQRLTLRGQTTGSRYWSINGSFTEPWLGGRKPIALSVGAYYSVENPLGYKKSHSSYGALTVKGASIGIGQRLRWPDNYFTLYQAVSVQSNVMFNYPYTTFKFSDYNGTYNDINYTITLGRQSLDAALFPKNGSEFSFSLQMTPPYSLLTNKDYNAIEEYKRYEFLEYYKWSFKAGIFLNPVADLVVNARFRMGVLNIYDDADGALTYPPFQRFYLGGDGLSGYEMTNREIIGMRGYANYALSSDEGSTAYSKMTLELRYPLTLNPAATIYALAFVEAGNAWDTPKEINPFALYKSAGVGVRLYMAAIGMFGLDWGYGFDRVKGDTSAKGELSGSRMHFSINQSLDW